jgi:hypothetical protein
MALLDIFRNLGEKMGKGMERNIGGLLGVDPESLTPAEREQARRLSQMAVFEALARGTTPFEGLRGAASTIGAQRERSMRQRAAQDIQQAQAAIAGRLGARGADVGEQTQLEEVRPMSGMNLQALLASPAGAAALESNPMLKTMAEEKLKPEDYTIQNVSGVGLVAVNKKNPREQFVVRSEVRQPREAPQPTLRQVRLANGMVQDMWIAPGQSTGTSVGAPYIPKGEAGAGETLNARQQSGVSMTRDAALQYAANLVGESVESLRNKTPQEIETLMNQKGGRVLQGATARTLSGLPIVGDFAKTVVEASNADLIGASTSGGAGIAMLQNPTGPITGTDVEVGIRQFPNPMLPVDVQAQMIRRILEQDGSVERYDERGNRIGSSRRGATGTF